MPDLDMELRRLASALVDDAPVAPSYDELSTVESVPVRHRERRARRLVIAVAVVLVGGLVVALLLRDRSSTRQQPLAPLGAVPECTLDQLRASFAFEPGGGPDSLLGSVIFINTSSEECELSGRPDDVEIVGDHGQLQLAQRPGGRAPTGGVPPAGPIILEAHGGSEAGVLLEWHNWCDGPQGPLKVLVHFIGWKASLEATPATGADRSLTPSCAGSDQASQLLVDYVRAHDATGFH